MKFVIEEMQKSAFGGGFSGATDEEPSGGYLARLQGANLANRKQDFWSIGQVFSMQIFGGEKNAFLILNSESFGSKIVKRKIYHLVFV